MIASLPLPFKIAAAVVAIVILLTIGAKMPLFVMIGALGCWVVAGVTLVYSAGMYSGALRLPVIGGIVRKLALPAPTNGATAPKTVDRGAMARNADAQLRSLAGNHSAVEAILKNLAPLATTRAANKVAALGAERAWLAIIHGPAGVGKSTIARCLAELLIGLGAAAKPIIVPLEARAPGQGDAQWKATLESSLDGIVLVDNARWLTEKSLYANSGEGEGLLEAINSVAERYPARLCIILTLTSEQRDQAFSTSKCRELMRRLTTVDLVCGDLGDADLGRIFLANIAKHGLSLPPELEPRIVRLVKRRRDYEQGKFDNAEAVRRMAETLSMLLAQSNGTRITAKDLEVLADTLENDV